MAKVNVKEIRERVTKMGEAWKEGAAAVSFGGIALTGFETGITNAEAIDLEIADLEAQVEMKKDERDTKYTVLDRESVMVRNGVVGDPAYGDDSPLYGAMGFVRKSERASGLTRKTKKPNG